MKNIKIAVIGKSSAGKSAFIKSFSETSSYIDSTGKGQTTRAYAEYVFLSKYDSKYPYIEAKFATKKEFAEDRTTHFIEQIKNKINDNKIHNIEWLKKQLETTTYENRIKNYLLCSNDFFNISEFSFLDKDIEKKSDEIYNEFKNKVANLNSQSQACELEDDGEENDLYRHLVDFYEKIYTIIMDCMDQQYKNNDIYVKENHLMYFKFEVNDEMRNTSSLCLKVNNETKHSLTGIITKIRISSELSNKYKQFLNELGIENITLIDTYGLDHSQGIERNVLIERYNKIFNNDFSDVSIVFLVEALHTGSSNDFNNAITTLYEIKPQIMTYVIGTHIDENEEELLKNIEWLKAEDKRKGKRPNLNGKVLDILNDPINLKATLIDNGVSETMAEQRCSVMSKRFCPFCGDLLNKDNHKINYEETNLLNLRFVFLSIKDREHLGDGYIEVDKILSGMKSMKISLNFTVKFLNNLTKRFREIYSFSASRTRWKIRENLERGILGFDGTTIDATWLRVIRDAFNQTFTKSDDGQMLSNLLELEGNSKIAFDEIAVEIFPYIFKRYCDNNKKLYISNNEFDCSKCFKFKKEENCIWNYFIRFKKYELFNSRNKYDRVIDWLNDLHDFSNENKELINTVATLFNRIITDELVSLCRNRNIYLASLKISQSNKSFIEVKDELFSEYVKSFDSKIEKSLFLEKTNECLASLKD